MIQPRTAIAVGLAGLGTLTGGAFAANAPDQRWGDNSLPKERLLATGLGFGGFASGVIAASTGPTASLKPLGAVAAAGIGGILLGTHVLGRLLDR